ncbi:hypothetical protein OIU84_012858 [Salix udensis]|uniref:DUF632 domain-containing protein n=1 Tax=Salix udensis TaxID=889485 RepID=A0AAD6JGR5_9ROSI|nr:hypothetical protein OIU84_012858 [Salix udensis]
MTPFNLINYVMGSSCLECDVDHHHHFRLEKVLKLSTRKSYQHYKAVSTTSTAIIGLRDSDLVPQLVELCHGFLDHPLPNYLSIRQWPNPAPPNDFVSSDWWDLFRIKAALWTHVIALPGLWMLAAMLIVFQLPHKASCSANNCPIWAMLVSGAAVVCREKSERVENAVLDSIEDENPQTMAQLLYSALNLEVHVHVEVNAPVPRSSASHCAASPWSCEPGHPRVTQLLNCTSRLLVTLSQQFLLGIPVSAT